MYYSSPDVRRRGAQYAADNCDAVALVVNPPSDGGWAATSAAIIAQAPITSADWSFSDTGALLTVTVAQKLGVDPSGTAAAGDDLTAALVDTVGGVVHYMVDAADRVVTNEPGDTIDIPSVVLNVPRLAAP